jgi:hypothetical protein
MKKLSLLTIIAMAAIALVSCKKERICNCTTTFSSGGVSTSSAATVTLIDATKRQAKDACISRKMTDGGDTYTQDCKLK